MADCGWIVGPAWKDDGETHSCIKEQGHAMPHECSCGAWFEGCGRDIRAALRGDQ